MGIAIKMPTSKVKAFWQHVSGGPDVPRGKVVPCRN